MAQTVHLTLTDANGQIKGGRHLAFNMRDYVPQGNLLVSMLGMVGVPIDKLGDSTGKLGGLSDL